MKKNILLLLVLALGVISLTACGKKEIENTTIAFEKDGKIVHTIVEDFPDEYSVAELQQMVKAEVDSFLQEADSKASITVDDISEMDPNKVKVTMTYSDADTFTAFQNMNVITPVTFFYGSVSEAYERDIDLNVTLHLASDDSTLISREDILKLGDKHILIMDPMMNYDSELGEGLPVWFSSYEKVYAVSDHVVIDDAKNVRTTQQDMVYVIYE